MDICSCIVHISNPAFRHNHLVGKPEVETKAYLFDTQQLDDEDDDDKVSEISVDQGQS